MADIPETETCILHPVEYSLENSIEHSTESRLDNSQNSTNSVLESPSPDSLPPVPRGCNDIVVCVITPYLDIMLSVFIKIGAIQRKYYGETLYGGLKIGLDRGNFMTLWFKIIHSLSYKNVEDEISTNIGKYFLFVIAGVSTDQFDSYNMSLLASYLIEKQVCKVAYINLSLIDMTGEYTPEHPDITFKKQIDKIRLAQMQTNMYRSSFRFKDALDGLYATSPLSVIFEKNQIIVGSKPAKSYFEGVIRKLLADITTEVKFSE